VADASKTEDRTVSAWRLREAGRAAAHHVACLHRIDDAVHPQIRGEIRGWLEIFVNFAHRGLERLFFLGRPLFSLGLVDLFAHQRHHSGGLIRTHDGRAAGRPGKHRGRIERAAAHRQVAGAVRGAHDDGVLGHVGRRHGRDHLGAGLGDPGLLGGAPDHETGHIGHEQQRDVALAAQINEVRRLHRAVREQHALVGQDADLVAMDARKAGQQGVAVHRLEFLKPAVVDKARQNLARVGRNLGVAADDAVNLARIEARRQRRLARPAWLGLLAQVPYDFTRDGKRVAVIFGDVVGDAADTAVHLGAAQRLGIHRLAGGGKGQLGTAEVHIALLLDNHRLVAQRRDVGATRRAGAHHHGNLLDAFGRHANLVVENAAELPHIGKDVGHFRQEGTTTVHQRDAGQAVCPGNLLRPHMLLAGHAVVGAALHGGVVGTIMHGARRPMQ
jgi:hypothetical protein